MGSALSLELIGFLAGILTTACWIPQVLRILATRDTQAISLITQITITAGCVLWTIYGVMAGSLSIFVFNLITAVFGGLITALKLFYRRTERGGGSAVP